MDDYQNTLTKNTEETIHTHIHRFLSNYKSPKELYEMVDEHVFGQAEAKKGLCTNIYYYLLSFDEGKTYLTNYNVLLLGPSGCGKTEIFRTIKKILWRYRIPVTIFDSSTLSASGYKGRDKEEVLTPLIHTNGIGIVFLDEFDKILMPTISSQGHNYNADTQASMLTMIEGSDVLVTKPNGRDTTVSTTNTMFVCMGAFQDMKKAPLPESHDEKVDKKLVIKGFTSGEEEDDIEDDNEEEDEDIIKDNPIIKDIINYGCMPELLGRFHSVYELHPLDTKYKIMIFDKIVKQYENALDCKIKFYFDDVVSYIIGREDDETGCRGIERRFKTIFDDIMFNYPFIEKPSCISILDKDEYYYKEYEHPLMYGSMHGPF